MFSSTRLNLQGRWYYRREAVKELHSTLIRLLNELSPWEPKLLKAFQRNRYFIIINSYFTLKCNLSKLSG